jgi:hypothetical protein
MEMRPALQIQTLIKALVEDVLPALDPTNQLAMQSAQLTIGTLHLIAQHLPLEYRYDCDELSRLLATAERLQAQAGAGTRTQAAFAALDQARSIGTDVRARARAEPAELVESVHRLRAATASTVRAVFAEGSEAAQRAVSDLVLTMSKEQLLRDRSWLLMQGWEPDPKAVPAIDTLLAPIGRG